MRRQEETSQASASRSVAVLTCRAGEATVAIEASRVTSVDEDRSGIPLLSELLGDATAENDTGCRALVLQGDGSSAAVRVGLPLHYLDLGREDVFPTPNLISRSQRCALGFARRGEEIILLLDPDALVQAARRPVAPSRATGNNDEE
jgi:hypothetical protein